MEKLLSYLKNKVLFVIEDKDKLIFHLKFPFNYADFFIPWHKFGIYPQTIEFFGNQVIIKKFDFSLFERIFAKKVKSLKKAYDSLKNHYTGKIRKIDFSDGKGFNPL